MTANTVQLDNGEEIAISQLLQANAAGAEPEANMNPVVMTPSEISRETRVILRGKYFDNINSYNFTGIKERLIPEIMNAYDSLSGRYDIIVIEGAGSPVELNLTRNSDDIVNMGIAKRVHAPVLLVSDIDRGGVFASLYGTVNLLDESERRYVKATVINRFQGEIAYFGDGADIIEDITGIPVAGIVPYVKFDIPEEDIIYNVKSSPYSAGNNLDKQFDLIAAAVRKSLNMDLIYQILDDTSGL